MNVLNFKILHLYILYILSWIKSLEIYVKYVRGKLTIKTLKKGMRFFITYYTIGNFFN